MFILSCHVMNEAMESYGFLINITAGIPRLIALIN